MSKESNSGEVNDDNDDDAETNRDSDFESTKKEFLASPSGKTAVKKNKTSKKDMKQQD